MMVRILSADWGGEDLAGLEHAADVGAGYCFPSGTVGIVGTDDDEILGGETVFDNAFDDEPVGVCDDHHAVVDLMPA